MFMLGLTYRPGFLVNSLELTGPVHVPPLPIGEHRLVSMKGLETLPSETLSCTQATWIGTYSYAGETQRVCIPPLPRKAHTHLIGKSGGGKSTTQEHMGLSDIEQGHGVAVLDPHGDLVGAIALPHPRKACRADHLPQPG